jgi:hypothetical protein
MRKLIPQATARSPYVTHVLVAGLLVIELALSPVCLAVIKVPDIGKL